MKNAAPRIGLVGPGLGLIVLLVIAALLLMAAAPAQAQEPRLVGRLPDNVRTQVDALLDAARANGIPTEALVDRALEGAAKGAPAALIVSAVTRLRDDLQSVRGALGTNSSAAELTAGASAVRAGASTADLVELRRRRPRQSLTVPTAVLADLVAAGVPSDSAVGAVLTLASEADDAAYLAFRRDVQRDIALGASPAAALGIRLQSTGLTSAQDNLTPGAQAGRPKRKP